MNMVQLIRIAALCSASLAIAPHVFAAGLTLPREGWASWEVPAVENAPDWCCFENWDDKSAQRRPCRLDGDMNGFGGRDDRTTDSTRVYARFSAGKLERLHAFSATCPVHAETEIQDLGIVSADDSARWLATMATGTDRDAKRNERVVDHAIAALAIHRGAVAHDNLADIARRDTNEENRKHAVFMLAHLRGTEGADVATSLMFGDPDADMREHAAFAVSQSVSPHAARDLIRLATTDKDADVRAHAWFSLALTKSAEAEGAIDAALRKEPDSGVRERAIFALSQLPEERATRALIKVAEDRSLAREERKRAVFWLSHSESSAAQAYLEKVLAKVAD